MVKRIGYIDSRRLHSGGVGYLSKIPTSIFPPNMDVYGIFEDFIGFYSLDADGEAKGWTFLEETDGTLDQADVAGGVIALGCGGADNDGAQIIMGGSAAGGAFWPAAGKDLYFEALVRHSNLGPAATNIFVGLIDPVNAAILADDGGALPNNDMLGFVFRDTEVNYSFVGDKAGAEDYNSLAVAIDTSWHYMGFIVNGVTSVDVYLDRVKIAAGAIATANIPVTGLMPALAVKAGDANAEYLQVDYVVCVQLR